jgi:phosphate starvation-inducible membrane PsiE
MFLMCCNSECLIIQKVKHQCHIELHFFLYIMISAMYRAKKRLLKFIIWLVLRRPRKYRWPKHVFKQIY